MLQYDQNISELAANYARKQKKQIVRDVLRSSECVPQILPAAVFMAGVPGAGKTEIAKRLIDEFTSKPLRIDIDDLRDNFREFGYDGHNSHLFQYPATILLEYLYDQVIEKKYNFILDTTFAKPKTVQSIERALKHGYTCKIYFIYQDPFTAWNFTKEREKVDNRAVPINEFIESYFISRQNVQEIKRRFGSQIFINLIVRDKDSLENLKINVESIDNYITKLYTRDELERLLQQ